MAHLLLRPVRRPGAAGPGGRRTADDAAYWLAQAAPAWRSAVGSSRSTCAASTRLRCAGCCRARRSRWTCFTSCTWRQDDRRRAPPGGARQVRAPRPVRRPRVPCERDVRGRLAAFYDWCACNDDIPELISLATTISGGKTRSSAPSSQVSRTRGLRTAPFVGVDALFLCDGTVLGAWRCFWLLLAIVARGSDIRDALPAGLRLKDAVCCMGPAQVLGLQPKGDSVTTVERRVSSRLPPRRCRCRERLGRRSGRPRSRRYGLASAPGPSGRSPAAALRG